MPIDLHVWSGVHSHSRRLARAPGPGRGGSRRRAAGDRIAAGRQPRWRSRAAHAKDRRRRSAYTGIANWSYRRWYIPPLRASPKTATKVSCGYSIGFVALGVGVSVCAVSVLLATRPKRAAFPGLVGQPGTALQVRVSIPKPATREASTLRDETHRTRDEHRHGRRRAFRGAIAVANVSCVKVRAPRSRAARRQLAAAIILRLFCSG